MDDLKVGHRRDIQARVSLEEMQVVVKEILERFNGRGESVMKLAKHRGSLSIRPSPTHARVIAHCFRINRSNIVAFLHGSQQSNQVVLE